MEKIFIIDAVNYLFRSYYAIGGMSNEKGQSTAALFGFIRSIKKIIKDFQPKYMVCVFDGPDNKKSRQALYAEYKMHRKGAPEDLFPQFELADNFCKLMGIPTLCIEGVEADDTMASIALWAEKHHLETYLCTSDKDLFQLVQKDRYVLLTHKNNLVVNDKVVKEMFGVKPSQILDYLAIVGDTSDNIPGLPGFGPKTAVELLNEFNDLDTILKNPEKVAGKKKQETLKNEQDKAILSKELARLNIKVDIPKEKKFYEIGSPTIEGLYTFYKEMSFKKFLSEIEEPSLPFDTKPKIKKTKEKEKTSYHIIDTEKELDELIKTLLNHDEICIDTETTSEKPLQAKLVGIGFGYKEALAWYIPFNGNLSEDIILEKIKPLFKSKKVSFFSHNIKYDLHVLKNYDIEINQISFDTIIASYLLNPEKRRHSLDALSLEFFGKEKTSYKKLVSSGKKSIPLKEVDIKKVSDYCCEDVDYTIRLKKVFQKMLNEEKLLSIFFDIELPLVYILTEMEYHGIYLDEKKLEKVSQDLSHELKNLEKSIYKKAGVHFNINSPKQLSDILYKKLELPEPKRKKTQYSTGSDILEKLKSKSDIVKDIISYRGLAKLVSTYTTSLPKQINKKTNRIHPTFNQSITATGRLSCQDPNLQNIPIKTPEGKKIRKCFRPSKHGWSYISADYSQIELRLLAHFSKDPDLINAFKKGEDIHAHTASIVYHQPLSKVTPKMRSIAKAVNFSTIYGQGAYGLSRLLDIPYKEADEFIKTYFEKYPNIKKYISSTIEKAKKSKYATTLVGRKRHLVDIDNKNPMVKAGAERLAINTPLQGTAADIIKIAMIEIDKELKSKSLESFLILQIHDELIFEVPDNEIDKMKKIIKPCMENAIKLDVPLTVDLQVGKNWGEC